MRAKRIELFQFLILITLLVLDLLGYKLLNLFIYLDFLCLIILWMIGFRKSDFWNRILAVPLMLGVILTTTNASYNNLFTTWGLFILTIYCLIKGIRRLSKKDICTGVELIFVSLVFCGYFLRMMHYVGGGIFRVVFLTSLQVFYIVMGIRFAVSFSKQKEELLGGLGMVVSWTLSIFVNAIMLDTMFWQGNMLVFWFAAILALIIVPVFAIVFFRRKDLPEDLHILSGKLFTRFIIISSISIFFATATPQQFLRFDFGNRPQIIEAYYNCHLNSDIDKATRTKNCMEFEQLDQLLRSGFYAQGLSDGDLEKMEIEAKNNPKTE